MLTRLDDGCLVSDDAPNGVCGDSVRKAVAAFLYFADRAAHSRHIAGTARPAPRTSLTFVEGARTGTAAFARLKAAFGWESQDKRGAREVSLTQSVQTLTGGAIVTPVSAAQRHRCQIHLPSSGKVLISAYGFEATSR